MRQVVWSWMGVLIINTAFSFARFQNAPQVGHFTSLQREKRQSAPVFTQTAYTFPTQFCRPGQQVGQISASGAGYYALITPSPNVSVNPYTGQIFLANIFSGPTTFQTVVSAFAAQSAYPNGPSATTTVTITITSCSGATSSQSGGTSNNGGGTSGNSPPTFSQPSFTLSATSCTAGSPVGSVTLSNSGGATFSISSSTPTSAFTINNNGLITITGSPLFGGTAQTFSVTATNAFGTATSNVIVNINCGGSSNGGSVTNIPPRFSQPSYSLTATSCTAGSPVGSVTLTNPTGATFAISPTTPTSAFTINSNGLITITGSPLFGGTAQTFTVTATNAFGTATSNVIINLNCGGSGSSGNSNQPPRFTQPSFTLTATSCTAGSSVGSVTVTNPTGITFSINPSSAFTINNNGLISTSGNPWIGTTPLTFTVTATNAFGTATSNVIINVNCGISVATPVFTQNPIVLSTTQCVPSGIIGSVTATNTQTYQLQPANPNFSINPITGALTLTNTVSSGLYPLTVQATSSSGAIATAVAQVTVSCSMSGTPGGSSQTYPVFGQKVYKYRFTDGCTSPSLVNLDQVFASTSPGALVSYSLSPDATRFTISSANGLIAYTGPINGCSAFEVIATDTMGRTSRVPVYVDCTVGSAGTAPCSSSQVITFVPATPSGPAPPPLPIDFG